MERIRRFILFLVAAMLAAPLLFKGHPPSGQDGKVAFLPSSSAGITVRVAGTVRAPGVYTVPCGVTVADVINLTASRPAGGMLECSVSRRKLGNGDVVEVAGENPQRLEIRVTEMGAGEQMLLGIPLHPDRMSLEDWEALPGIGPKLAKSIIVDRQNNGEFRTLEAVARVPGVGEKKLAMIRKYFQSGITSLKIK